MKIFKKMLKERSVKDAGRNGNWNEPRMPTTIFAQSYRSSFDRTVKDNLKQIGGDHGEEDRDR